MDANKANKLLHRNYDTGRIGAEIAANKLDIDRGWSVARNTLVNNEIAAASARGLTDVSRRWLIWSEVVKAMDMEEAREYRAPGCCSLTCVWFMNLFSFVEFMVRISWHAFMAGFWGSIFKCCCRQEDPNVLANMGFHGLACSAYIAAAGVICHNLSHPSKPSHTLSKHVRLDRPVPPIAAGERIKPEDPDDTIRPRGLIQNLCFACQAKHPVEHIERLVTGLFCCMSGPRGCHPSVCCGPCCSCCRPCYNTLPQRIQTWNEKIESKRGPALQAFYLRKFGVNSYEEYLQKRLAEMASQAPEAVGAMERGVDVQDLEEGLALGLLEAFVGNGPPRDGTPSAPARAALGVFKGVVGIAPRHGQGFAAEAEVAGAERGQELSGPVKQALAIVQAVMGDIKMQAQERSAGATQALQTLKEHTEEETKGGFAL
eukprot:TRINITY_DN3345_c0_g1_i2.p1 TRINITY_DN3345_c0_g1~~TRINITY_DN3345_c0_g1_i2.p1  ORF type:complete len:429 (-),score=126.82 TRINITY_DN3345_c0_g1_i2:49-1335(-)